MGLKLVYRYISFIILLPATYIRHSRDNCQRLPRYFLKRIYLLHYFGERIAEVNDAFLASASAIILPTTLQLKFECCQSNDEIIKKITSTRNSMPLNPVLLLTGKCCQFYILYSYSKRLNKFFIFNSLYLFCFR